MSTPSVDFEIFIAPVVSSRLQVNVLPLGISRGKRRHGCIPVLRVHDGVTVLRLEGAGEQRHQSHGQGREKKRKERENEAFSWGEGKGGEAARRRGVSGSRNRPPGEPKSVALATSLRSVLSHQSGVGIAQLCAAKRRNRPGRYLT